MIKLITRILILNLITFTMLYLAASFVYADFNFITWGEEGRKGIISIIMLLNPLIIIAAAVFEQIL